MSIGTDLAPGTWIVNRNRLPWVKAKILGNTSVGDVKGYSVELDAPYNGTALLPFANLKGWEPQVGGWMNCPHLENENGEPVCTVSTPGGKEECRVCPATTREA